MLLCTLCLLSLLRESNQNSHGGPDSATHLLRRLWCHFRQGRAALSQPLRYQRLACKACSRSHPLPHLLLRLSPPYPLNPPLLDKMGKHRQQLPCKLLSRCCKQRDILTLATLHHHLPTQSTRLCQHTSHHCQGPLLHSRHCHRCPRHSQLSQRQWTQGPSMLQLARHGMLLMLHMLGMLCPRSILGHPRLFLDSSLGTLICLPCSSSRGYSRACNDPIKGSLRLSSLSRQVCSSITGQLLCTTSLPCCRTSRGHRPMAGHSPAPRLHSSTHHRCMLPGHRLRSRPPRHSHGQQGRAAPVWIGRAALEGVSSKMADLLQVLQQPQGKQLQKQTWVTFRRPVWPWTPPQIQGQVLRSSGPPLRGQASPQCQSHRLPVLVQM